MCEDSDLECLEEAYANAIECFSAAKRSFYENEIKIEIARIETDTEDLRRALSRRNELQNDVDIASKDVQTAKYNIVRYRGMGVEPTKISAETEQDPGIIQKILRTITKI